jgi:hypothetical protein
MFSETAIALAAASIALGAAAFTRPWPIRLLATRIPLQLVVRARRQAVAITPLAWR